MEKHLTEAELREFIVKYEAELLGTSATPVSKYQLATQIYARLKQLEEDKQIPSAQLAQDLLTKDAITQALRLMYILLPLPEIIRRIVDEFQVDWANTFKFIVQNHKEQLEDYSRRLVYQKFLIGDQVVAQSKPKRPTFAKTIAPVNLNHFFAPDQIVGLEVGFKFASKQRVYQLHTEQEGAPIFLHSAKCKVLSQFYGEELPQVVYGVVKAVKQVDSVANNEYGVPKHETFWVMDVEFPPE